MSNSSRKLGVFGRIGQFFADAAENAPRVQQVRHLQSLTDAQLAAKGMRREDIVRHVYRDVLYI